LVFFGKTKVQQNPVISTKELTRRGQGTRDRGDQRPMTNDQGPGPRTSDFGLRTQDPGPQTSFPRLRPTSSMEL